MSVVAKDRLGVGPGQGAERLEERPSRALLPARRLASVLCVALGDDDNDNDTLREVPHPSNEGLALQARV